jgi:hypothetical protein
MPPSLRARAPMMGKKKKQTRKMPGCRGAPKKQVFKLPKDAYDADFVQSDAESISVYSSDSEKEPNLPTYTDSDEVVAEKPKTPKKTRRTAQKTPESVRSMSDHQDQLIVTLNKVVALQEQMLKGKDELIASQSAEIERLRRMVRSLEIQ